MDLDVILVIGILTALSIGAIIWMELHSRKAESKDKTSKVLKNEVNNNKNSPKAKQLSRSKMGVNT